MEGTIFGEMLSAIRLARRSSSASTSAIPLTLLVRSSTPNTMMPPEVFANATMAFRTPSGEESSRLNSSVLPSCRLRRESRSTTLHFTRQCSAEDHFRVAQSKWGAPVRGCEPHRRFPAPAPHRRQHGLLVLAIRVGTLQHRPGLQPLLHHVRAAALGALLLHRLAPGHEVAIRPAVAAVERLAALGAPLHHLALAALRALHADGLLLHMLARRIIAASGKLAETAGLQHHVAAAHRALLVELHIRLLLRAANGLAGLAVRVPGAGEEGAEAALLQHHGTAAVLAVFFVALLGQVYFVHIWQIDGKFARVGAIGISGASDEAAVAAPLDHQGLAALLADQVGGPFHPLDVGHVLFGVLQVFVELFEELPDG